MGRNPRTDHPLAIIRSAWSVTVEEFADLVGASPGTIRNCEAGRPISEDLASTIERCAGLSAKWLLRWKALRSTDREAELVRLRRWHRDGNDLVDFGGAGTFPDILLVSWMKASFYQARIQGLNPRFVEVALAWAVEDVIQRLGLDPDGVEALRKKIQRHDISGPILEHEKMSPGFRATEEHAKVVRAVRDRAYKKDIRGTQIIEAWVKRNPRTNRRQWEGIRRIEERMRDPGTPEREKRKLLRQWRDELGKLSRAVEDAHRIHFRGKRAKSSMQADREIRREALSRRIGRKK